MYHIKILKYDKLNYDNYIIVNYFDFTALSASWMLSHDNKNINLFCCLLL